jgi:hypothetical protein
MATKSLGSVPQPKPEDLRWDIRVILGPVVSGTQTYKYDVRLIYKYQGMEYIAEIDDSQIVTAPRNKLDGLNSVTVAAFLAARPDFV